MMGLFIYGLALNSLSLTQLFCLIFFLSFFNLPLALSFPFSLSPYNFLFFNFLSSLDHILFFCSSSISLSFQLILSLLESFFFSVSLCITSQTFFLYLHNLSLSLSLSLSHFLYFSFQLSLCHFPFLFFLFPSNFFSPTPPQHLISPLLFTFSFFPLSL